MTSEECDKIISDHLGENTSAVFKYGDTVYVKTDPDQLQRMVTGLMITGRNIEYRLCHNAVSTWHFPEEISKNKNGLL